MKHSTSHKRIISIVKVFLYVFSAILLAFLLFAFIVSSFYKTEVKEFIIAELNKNVRSEIVIGDTDLSLLRHFPYASLCIHNVYAKEATDKGGNDTLLFAERLDLSFNILNIFRNRYNIKAISISNAKLNIKVFDDYTNNYTFWQQTEDSHNEAFEINLEKISCNNTAVSYSHAPSLQTYDFILNEAVLSGKIYKDEFSVNMTTKAFVNRLTIDDLLFLEGTHTHIKLLLDANTNTETYTIKKGSLEVGDMSFNVSGHVVTHEDMTDLNLNIKSNRLKIQDFIKQLPEQYQQSLDNYKMEGIIRFDVGIKGPSGGGHTPLLQIDYEMLAGSLTQKTSHVSLSNLSFKGFYTNGEARTMGSSVLFFEHFSASLKQGRINGQLEIRNLVSPHIAFTLSLQGHLKEVLALAYPDLFDGVSGTVSGDISFRGQLNSFGSFVPDDFLRSRCEGYLNIQNAALSFNNKRFSQINAALKFNNNDVVIDSLSALYEQTDMTFKGYFRNALAYVFIPQEKVFVDASLFSNNMLLKDILTDNSEVASSTNKFKLSFSERVNFRFRIFVENFIFDKFLARQLSGQFNLNNKILTADSIKFNAFDGRVSMSGRVNGQNANSLAAECRALFSRCDINKMFHQMNNFGQDNLSDKNLKGYLTATVNYAGKWQSDLTADMESINTQAQIVVENGELLAYGPIMELSRFIRLRDLSHIRFEKMENTILISEQCIHIPHMEIRSDAVNIKASGTHHFSNHIDYRLEVRLSELLGRKARREKPENEEFGILQEETGGGLTLFLKITGHMDNPVVSYDTRTAVTRVTTEIKADVKNTFEKIKEEFSPSVRDTINRFETEREKERRRRRRENEIPNGFKIE